MTVIGEAYVVVRPDTKGFASSAEHEVESGLGSTVRKVATLIGGALVLGGAKEFVGSLIDSAREAERMAAQTAAVIKSTGAAAGESVEQVDKLGTKLSDLTGIDRVLIQNNENLLLTFTNIRNGVGAGNDIFDRATKATLDMSKALGEDGKNASIQLGKALNDPIKGLTALTRVGVLFTEQQKDQIKVLVAHGDVMGAQRIILDELSREFGGSAEAQATAADRLSATWENLKETLGSKLLPVIDAVAGWLADELPGALDVSMDAAGRFGSFIGDTFAKISAAVTPTLQTIGGAISDFWQGFTEGTDELGSAQTSWAQWGAVVYEWVQKITAFFAEHWQPVLVGALGLIGLFTAPVTTVAAGLVLLYVKSEKFRDIVEATRVGAVKFGQSMVQLGAWLDRTFGPVLLSIGSKLADLARYFAERWEKIRVTVTNVLTALKVTIGVFLTPMMVAWRYFHEQIMAVVTVVWNTIATTIQTSLRIISDIFDLVISLLSGHWGDAWNDVKDILGAAVDWISATIGNFLKFVIDFFSSLPSNIISALGDLAGTLGPKALELMQGLLNGVVSGFVAVGNWFNSLPGQIVSWIGDIAGALAQVGVQAIVGLWNGVLAMKDYIIGYASQIPGWLVDAISAGLSAIHDVAVQIVVGLWQGVQSMKDWLWGKLGDFFTSAWSYVKAIFHVGSPSRLAMELGQQVVEGYALGVEGGADRVANAHKTLLNGFGAGAGMSPTAVSSLISGSLSANADGGMMFRDIVVPVSIDSSTTKSHAEQIGATVADVVAARLAPLAARRLTAAVQVRR